MPVAVEVFAGNTGDPNTVGRALDRLLGRFKLKRVIMVGDRGMITDARIKEELRPRGVDWITALRATTIGVEVGKVLGGSKVAKHFNYEITSDTFTFQRDQASIATDAALDGIYVIRTNVSAETLGAPEVVEAYKQLAEVEKAFRIMKGFALEVEPIRHRREERIRAHVFLCMLAHYVLGHIAAARSKFEERTHEEIDADRGIRSFHLGHTGLAGADALRQLGLSKALGLPLFPEAFRQGQLELDELRFLRRHLEEVSGISDLPARGLQLSSLLRVHGPLPP